MSLFITRKNTTYEIHDVYVMALSFSLGILVVQIAKEVLKKLEKRKKDKIVIPNPRGGYHELSISLEGVTINAEPSNSELGSIILTCIADNTNYVVLNEKIKALFDVYKQFVY